MQERSSGGVRIFSLDRAAIREALRRLVDTRYAPDPNVRAVILFGSYARGQAVPGSDVDLLIVLDRDPRPARDRIPDYLPDGFPVGIDVIPWTCAELEERRARHDRLATRALTEGEFLLDRLPGRPSGETR